MFICDSIGVRPSFLRSPPLPKPSARMYFRPPIRTFSPTISGPSCFHCSADCNFTTPRLAIITLAIKYPKIVILAETGIASRTIGVCRKMATSAGVTVVCLAARLIKGHLCINIQIAGARNNAVNENSMHPPAARRPSGGARSHPRIYRNWPARPHPHPR